MAVFIDEHRGSYGVEPICAVLPCDQMPDPNIRPGLVSGGHVMSMHV